ncbi:excalibur calcium-binding domain-containing protein [Gordonia sp. NB41Y]|uniref:excalibur calcium-binding domain-containing protein n=1 Tax=Gordonia sp. NB41Y TaxID=875808 RepID=UPI0002BF6873|nr:excalibur calcium-binding domain-containing protein [Gordonia sp. NB41Y]WLP92189.1 excalibur calcium-binding domain-containing protein [Gordonia sp. NB41Y]
MTTQHWPPTPPTGDGDQSPTPSTTTKKPLLIIGAIVVAILLMCGGCGVGSLIGNTSDTAAPATTTVTSFRTVTETATPSTSAPTTTATPTSTSTATTGVPNTPAEDTTVPRGLIPQTGTQDETTDKPAAGGGGSVSYSSCAQARAAGAAPLYRGQPGYSSSLDRDGDGVACE